MIGGMVSSTLLTLVVVPAVYSLVEGHREHRRAARSARAPGVRTGSAGSPALPD